MTNADKFLKDKESEKEFIEKFVSFALINGVNIPYRVLRDFFEQPVQPTLTEDERVILRNIKDGIDTIMSVTICRNNGELYIEIPSTQEKIELYMFNHLFQFIKERRRI